MPRSRNLLSVVRPESFNVRWHSLANPATPSADIMSSPDPLNETTVTELVPPSTTSRRPVTRSQRSQRSQSNQRFASTTKSPRKQMFELEVSDTRAPQRLWVTVETDDGSAPTAASARRKLFQSPGSTGGRGRAVTVVTAPLCDSENRLLAKDGLATPKAKGRPRKSNVMPMPGATRAKAAVSAGRKTLRATRFSDATKPGESRPEARVQPTPSAERRGRPPKRRILELDGGSADIDPGRPAAKQTMRAHPELTFEEWVGAADPASPGQPPEAPDASAPGEDDMDLVGVPEIPVSGAPEDGAPDDHDQDSDIWMATLSSDGPSKASAAPPSTLQTSGAPQLETVRHHLHQETHPGDHDDLILPPASDVSSLDEPAGELESQANDTIAQGENFSVIFMDSIPSLQGVFNSSIPPVVQEPLGEETSLIINNTLQSLRRSAGQASAARVSALVQSAPPEPPVTEPEDVDSEIVSDRAPAVRTSGITSPNRGPSRRHSRSPHRANSASSPRQQHMKSVKGHTEVLAAHDADQTADQTPSTEIGSGRGASDGHGDEHAYPLYQDSFSEIPQKILMAAAPTQARAEAPHDDKNSRNNSQDGDEDADAGDLAAGTSYEGLPRGSNASSASQSEAGRLPTPDDTPPQAEIPDAPEEQMSQNESEVSRGPTPPEETPAEPKASESGPPGPEELGRRASVEAGAPSTPSREATPARQASWPQQEPQAMQQDEWQDKTSRSTLSAIVRAGKALQSVTSDPPSPEGQEKQLRSPFKSSGSRDSWNGSRDSQGSRRMSRCPQRSLSTGDDPFGPATQSTGQARFMEALGRGLTADHDQAPAGGPPSSSMRVTPQSEDAMSWVAKEGPISPRLRGDVTLLDAHGAASASSHMAIGSSTWLRQRDRKSSNGAPDDTIETQDDETDLWEVQAQRESPRSVHQRPCERRTATSNQGRGNKPRTGDGGRTGGLAGSGRWAVVQPEEDASAEQEEWREESGLEEYSLVAERRNQQQQQQQQEATTEETASASGAKRFDLSAFSSPASIPRMPASKLLPGRTATESRQASLRPEPKPPTRTAMTAGGIPTSSMFPPVPPEKLRPGSSGLGGDAPSLRAVADRSSDTDRTTTMPSSPEPPAAEQMPAAASAQGGATPPRMQLSHADIHRWQQETSKAGDVSRPCLRPLPTKNASPTKSSMRSPLKPRTPGRVVEFTSSVLSPAEQARVRQERLLSLGLAAEEEAEPHLHQGASQAVHAPPLGDGADDDGNGDSSRGSSSHRRDASDDADVDAARPLTRTAWTRRHWLLLDQLIQLRRNRPLAQRYPRTADRFLGKTVRSQGEALRLERWHLDCVDAFAAEVTATAAPGILVKRLAALILAEQQRRRRRGRATKPPPRDAMFH